MKKSVIVALVLLNMVTYGQSYSTGCIVDEDAYNKLPLKKEVITRSYMSLPKRYSLQKYCPYAKTQSHYGTCTSWATAYAARTIAEAVKNNWTKRDLITLEAFSPIFVYAQIKDPSDIYCQRGSYIEDALELLKGKGVPKYIAFDTLCATYIPDNFFIAAKNYTIDYYCRLFSPTTTLDNKVYKVKKAISENCPVVISMDIPEPSFYNAKTYFVPSESDTSHGYHAMCAVGYDDTINGGSFLIMNSWGTWWGADGFTWVTYQDFYKYVRYAYEISVNAPKDLKGEIELQLSTGENMSTKFTTTKDSVPYYVTDEEYLSGTRYRLYLSNNEPAYVYIIGSDLKNNVSKVFPPNDTISPALLYKSNNIAIPDETYYIEMDNTKGKDYMCVLYSKEELDINNIITGIKNTEGTFYEKVIKVMDDKVAYRSDIEYATNNIGFSAKTNKTAVPLFIEITHK